MRNKRTKEVKHSRQYKVTSDYRFITTSQVNFSVGGKS